MYHMFGQVGCLWYAGRIEIKWLDYLLSDVVVPHDDHRRTKRPEVEEGEWRSAKCLVHGDKNEICRRP